MSTPMMPMRRQPSLHAKVVIPVGLMAVVWIGSASSLKGMQSKVFVRCAATVRSADRGSHTAHGTVFITFTTLGWMRPFQLGQLRS